MLKNATADTKLPDSPTLAIVLRAQMEIQREGLNGS